MKVRLFLSVILLVSIVLALPIFTQISAQKITLSDTKQVYELPYPGILPDHPLFFIKNARDKIVEFLTREPMKKAQLYLHASDKKVAMVSQLIKKGKDKLAIETATEAEEYFAKIADAIKTSKEQGVGPTEDFLNTLRNSNMKHRQIYEEQLKELPQGGSDSFAKVLDLVSQNGKAINKLK